MGILKILLKLRFETFCCALFLKCILVLQYLYFNISSLLYDIILTYYDVFISLWLCTLILAIEKRLDEVLDSENNGVPIHLGQIAGSMSEWEGPIAEQLGLLTADVAAIKARHPGELKLQTYVIKTLSPVL